MAYKIDIILDILKAIAFLPEDSQLRILKASIAYLRGTESEVLQGAENMAFTMLLPTLQKEKEKELNLSLARSKSGKQGGRGKAKKAIALLALEKESTSSSSPTPPSTPPKEIIILDNAPTHTREENFDLVVGIIATEEQYARRYQQENMWADAALQMHLTIAQTQEIFKEFVAEQKHNSTRHEDYSRFKSHFFNYLRCRAEKLRQTAKAKNNGNQRKYDDRRGTEVSSSADYFEPL